MAKVKVPLYGNLAKAALIDSEATKGATFGTNFYLADGSLATATSLAALLGVSTAAPVAAAHRLLLGLTLGDDHPQYTRKDTLTTRGDLYYRNTSTVARLAKGTDRQFLRANTTDPAWETVSPVVTLSTDLSGNVTLTNLSSGTLAATIVTNAVTDTKLRDSAALSVIGRASNSSGDPADIASAGSTDVLRRSGTAIGFGSIDHTYISDFNEAVQDVVGIEFVDSSEIDFTYDDTAGTVSASLINGSIAYARIADLSALSVLGRASNSSGTMAAVVAGTDGQILRRSGTSIAFGAVDLASANAITGDLPFANLTQGAALSVLGVTGSTTADLASIAAGSDGQVLRRSGTAVSFGAIDLASANAITGDLPFANFTQGSARSVLAVAGASTADFAALQAGSDDTLLGRTSGSLSFGQLTVGMFPANVVTYAKIQQVSATSRVLGRITTGAGNVEELTGANLATIIGTSLGANPSASVGLTAVNGSAGTYMRSDGAPPLDQGIAPTWTAQHLFYAAGGAPARFWRQGVNGAGIAGVVSFDTDAKTAGDGMVLSFRANNSSISSHDKDYGYLGLTILSAVAGSESASFDFFTIHNGTGPAKKASISSDGGFLFSDGTVSLTGQSWLNDTDTGRYRIGANNMGDVVGGALIIDYAAARVSFQIPVRLKGYTVATLPAGTAGDTAYVTDALAPVFLGAAAGGGAITCTVFYNGANWVVQ